MAELSAHTKEALKGLPKEDCIDIILFQTVKIAELEKENADLKQQLEEVQKENADHEKRLENLEARVNLNSTNSSRPPSSDPPVGTATVKRLRIT